MKKTLLSVEILFSPIHILLILASLVIPGGLLFALILMFFLGVWQYIWGFIWMITGDKRRIPYFIAATLVLGGLFANNELDLFTRNIEEMLNVGLMGISLLLGIWYVVIAYQHHQHLVALEKELQDENGVEQLL